VHLWLPNAYTYAPSVVTVFLAATATKVAIYVLIRFSYSIFGFDFAFLHAAFTWVLLPFGLAGIFIASIVAVFQEDVKRMLAYSSVAQIGYMLLGLSFATVEGLTASLVHILNHAMMKGALFMGVACVVFRAGGHTMDAFAGLGKRMPFTTWAIILSGLSLVGVPMTAGFISKWYLMSAAFAAGHWYAAFLIVASSLIALVYFGRVAEVMLLREPAREGKYVIPAKDAPFSMLAPMWILIIANIYFGVRTEWTGGLAERAATALMSFAGGAS